MGLDVDVAGGDGKRRTRYRFVVLPLRKRTGPWRETRAEAVEDAIKAGFAERDEFVESRVWFDPLAEIEVEEG